MVNRCYVNKDHPDETYPGIYDGHKTLWEGYQATVKRIPELPHLGTRNVVLEDGTKDYSWRSWREVYDMQNAFARGKSLFVRFTIYPSSFRPL